MHFQILFFALNIIYLSLAIPDFEEHQIADQPLVTTPLGTIKGTIVKSRLGKSINSFRGIRYAKPPVGDLRFKPPVAVEKWEGILNATENGPLCPQPSDDPTSEDCLFVNVYSTKLPNENENPKRPVIVYIHAGGWYSVGAASYYEGPEYFLDQDIVLVVFQYRLGTLGFLSTGDKEAPGNNGMKDQVLLLKWVKDNIEAFGGDPDSVTIMGYSAGGWSVTMHMVSPMSKGLFHKAIAMSGSALGPWPIPYDQLDLAKKQAGILGCRNDTSEIVITCLREKSATEIGDSLSNFTEFGNDPILIWSPVIEQDFGQERFLTDHPTKLMVEGNFYKVPFISGSTSKEFGYGAFDVVNDDNLLNQINNNFDEIAPIAFLYERGTNFSKSISRGVKSFYFDNQPIDKSLKQFTALSEVYADSVTGFGTNRAVKVISEKNTYPVYFYSLTYSGRYSHFYIPNTNNTKTFGPVHHDDLIYLFYISKIFPQFQDNDPESKMVEKLTTLYANFAKTGNPTPNQNEKLDNLTWEPFSMNSQKYLDMGERLIMKEKLFEKRYNEWEKLLPLSHYIN